MVNRAEANDKLFIAHYIRNYICHYCKRNTFIDIFLYARKIFRPMSFINSFWYSLCQNLFRTLFDHSVIQGCSFWHRFSSWSKFLSPLSIRKTKSCLVENWIFCKTWRSICLLFALFSYVYVWKPQRHR